MLSVAVREGETEEAAHRTAPAASSQHHGSMVSGAVATVSSVQWYLATSAAWTLLDLEQPGPCYNTGLDTLLPSLRQPDSGPTHCHCCHCCQLVPGPLITVQYSTVQYCCQLVAGPLITGQQMFVKTKHKLSPLFIRCNILRPAATWPPHHQLSQLSTDN